MNVPQPIRSGISPRITLGLTIGLLLALMLLPVTSETLWSRALRDTGHAPAFALLAAVTMRSYHRGIGRLGAGGVALALSVLLGLITEVLQLFVGRLADPFDFGRDILGAATAVLVVRSWGLGARARTAAVIVVALAAAVSLQPIVSASRALSARDRAMPVVFGFEPGFESEFVRTRSAQILRVDPTSADYTAELSFEPGDGSAVIHTEPYPDWRGYERLVFEVHGYENRPVTLHLRIDDETHGDYDDRFQTQFVIVEGCQRLVVPLAEIRDGPSCRPLDLSRISSVVLFMYRLDTPSRVGVGPMRLEGGQPP